jgi:hypothetical protein
MIIIIIIIIYCFRSQHDFRQSFHELYGKHDFSLSNSKFITCDTVKKQIGLSKKKQEHETKTGMKEQLNETE